jgi:hypothetical protein
MRLLPKNYASLQCGYSQTQLQMALLSAISPRWRFQTKLLFSIPFIDVFLFSIPGINGFARVCSILGIDGSAAGCSVSGIDGSAGRPHTQDAPPATWIFSIPDVH